MPRWRFGERLDDVIEDACRRYADRTAVAIEGADIAYREFDARANQMARLFIHNGVKPGDRVAVLLDRGLEGYVALFALLKARAVYVPLDVNYPPERIRHILADAERLAHRRASPARRSLRRLRSSPVHSRQGALRARRAGRRALARGRARSGRRRALLYPLYIWHDRPTQGRRRRASEHLQFRARRERALWLWPGRAGLSRHVGRLRFLDRGVVGSLGRRRDDRSQRGVDELVRRGARRFSRIARRDLLLLRADAARLDGSRSAATAHSVDRRRSLPSRLGQALESARPQPAQQLRPGGSHGDRDPGALEPGKAGHHRPAVADVFDRHSRSRARRGGRVGRSGRNRHRRHWRRRGLSQSARIERGEVHPRFPGARQQSVGPHLSHRRSRPHQRGRRDRISRAHRHPGEAARLSRRTDRNRIGAARNPRNRASRGHDLRARARRDRNSSPIIPSNVARPRRSRARSQRS